jgi:hypothetical protein
MKRQFDSDPAWDPAEILDMPPETQVRPPMGKLKRVVLFGSGLALGALLFLIAGIGSQPTPPQCHSCAVLNTNGHSSACAEAVQGGWVCDAH